MRKGQFVSIEVRVTRLTNKNGPIPKTHPELGQCWIWQGTCTPDGYALIKLSAARGERRATTLAHQVPWIALHGPKPQGMHLDHLCRVRNCVNPDHLELVTPKENNRRSTSPSARNGQKTHCQNGHKFTLDNTQWCTNGQRACKICRAALRRAATLKRNPDAGPAMALRTHCPHEHEYTPENTRIYQGRRFCRACMTIRAREYKARKAA